MDKGDEGKSYRIIGGCSLGGYNLNDTQKFWVIGVTKVL